MSHQRKHQVAAPIAGTIWKITTTIGSEVGEEDTVLIMESMKMEMPVEAGRAGTVVEIRVKEGDPTQEGNILVVIDVK
jgi:acetyl-CoA carboxylase biotin carboxyl carrier protein